MNPVASAYFVAIAETALALALSFGLFSNLAYIGGSLLAFVIYNFVFALLWQQRARLYLGLDRCLGNRLNSLTFVAFGKTT